MLPMREIYLCTRRMLIPCAMKTVKPIVIGAILHYRSLLVLCTLLCSFATTAQVKFETRVQSKKVGKEDPFRVEYIIENAESISSFQEPEFNGFTVLQGPSQGQSTSIMNGKVSQYVFVAYIIQAKKTGKFTIPGTYAVIGGKKIKSQNIQVEVFAGSTGRPPVTAVVPTPRPSWDDVRPNSKELYLKPGENAVDKIRGNLFVKADIDRSQCYVGEPIVATYKLYTRLQSESKVTKRPSLNGFSVYDMVDPESAHARTETLNGKDYNVYYIRKTQLYPLQPGKVTLEPVEVENKVLFYQNVEQQRPGRTMDDLVREFFNDVPMGEAEEHTLTLSSKPMEVNVLPLPEEHKPATFTGAVGQFTLKAALEADGIATGKSGTLVLTLEGAGNFPMITAPVVNWPASFDAFDPSAEENINKQEAPIAGAKQFKYIFTPSDTGHFTIPPVQFAYFDPKSKKYVTAETAALSLDVAMGADYGKKAVSNTATASTVDSSTIIKLLMGAAILLVLVLGYFAWNNKRKVAPVVQVKKPAVAPVVAEPAPVVVQEPAAAIPVKEDVHVNWTPLEEMIASGDSKGFYQAMGNQVWQFFSKKLSLTGSERNKRTLVQKLTAAGVGAEETAAATSILSDCEMALYTPVHSASDMQLMLANSKELVRVLSEKL